MFGIYFYRFCLLYLCVSLYFSLSFLHVFVVFNLCFSFCFLTSVQFSSVTQSCLTLCDPMNHSTPGLLVHHQLPEFTQTHAHWVGDAIQPSHPLSSPSHPAPNPSQHQGLFQWVNSSHEVAKVLEFQLQHQSFRWTPRTSPSGWTGWISLQSKGLSRVFSNTTVQKHQFFRCSAFFTVQLSHPYMTTGKTITLTRWTYVGKVMSLLFNMLSRLVITFLPMSKQAPFNFMAAITTGSDFGAPEK